VSDVGEVRAEDAFDVDRLAAWLVRVDPSLVGTPAVRQFSGGASNLTYALSYPDRDVILRRPPRGAHVGTAHDMGREYAVQAALRTAYPLVPHMVANCTDPEVIGSPFYVMERIEGTILRKSIPSSLGLAPADVERLCRNAIDAVIDLHGVDVQAAGLSDLDRGAGYVSRQVAGWSSRMRAARTGRDAAFEAVMDWLAEHQPPDQPHTLIHNDFRFDNLVLAPSDPTQIVGVLDWEMATVGDPLMDLAGALAYWVQADDDRVMRAMRLQPTHTPGMLTRDQVVDYYCDRRGIAMDRFRWTWYEVFGLFRLAVIAQQIYHRYHHGQTTNPAFKKFRWLVSYLELRCRATMAGLR
jgi:aminoglycoside phosphotransferase (APT) family kinase protein